MSLNATQMKATQKFCGRTAKTENGLNKVAKVLPIELYFN